MIERRRTPDGRVLDIDHGPCIATHRRGVPPGTIARPAERPARRQRAYVADPFSIASWKRMKRATDPEWHARELAQDKARRDAKRAVA